jgi:SNF2 family DNA or RNA helicase
VITFFTCLALRYDTHGPHLVVMPLSVLSSWKSDISKYCSIIKPYIHLGPKEERESSCRQWFTMLRSLPEETDDIHVCLTTYDMVLKDTSLLAQLSVSSRQPSRSSSIKTIHWSYIVVCTPPPSTDYWNY